MEKIIEKITRAFLLSVNLGKYELMPSRESCREVKVYKLITAVKPGDHIAVWQTDRGYWHHGIYYGEDEDEDAFVVDITPTHGIACRLFEDFIRKEEDAIVVDYDGNAFTREATLKYAAFVIGNNETSPTEYNVFQNNCDMLAVMLRTGMWVQPTTLPQPANKKKCMNLYSIKAKLGL